MPTSTERVRRFRERKALDTARREYGRLLRRVRAVEAERDRLRVQAAERLHLLLEQARVWRGELERLREAETTTALIESGVPTVAGDAEAP